MIISESIYVTVGWSKGGSLSFGTAFMIAPGILATVAHVTYKNRDDNQSVQDNLRVMRYVDIDGKQKMEVATVIDNRC